MHLRSILAIARKDALDIILNKTTLTLLLSIIIGSIFFAFLSGLFSSKTTDMLIYNPGGSGVEQVVSGAFANTHVTQASSPGEVAAAFGANGTHKSTPYTLGMVIPADFDSSLRASGHPQLTLFVNGDDVDNQSSQILVQALADYTRSVVNPQVPANINVATINPPTTTNAFQDTGKFLTAFMLVYSFLAGFSLVPGLLVEEKEKKTLRMLMVSPASFYDVVMGKLLVGLGYQLVLSGAVLLIQGGFTGQIPMVLLFTLLGAMLAIAVGLLAGSIFSTMGAVGAFIGIVGSVIFFPALFVGPLGQAFQGSALVEVLKAFPTYYLADGIFSAMQNVLTFGAAVLDGGVVLGCTLVLLTAAVWMLRRQAAVVGAI